MLSICAVYLGLSIFAETHPRDYPFLLPQTEHPHAGSTQFMQLTAARLSLANIVLSLAGRTRDAAALKSEAVRMFRLKRPLAN